MFQYLIVDRSTFFFFFSETTVLSNDKLLKKSYNINLIAFDCSPTCMFILICSGRFVVILSEQGFVDFLMKNKLSRYCLTGQDLQWVRILLLTRWRTCMKSISLVLSSWTRSRKRLGRGHSGSIPPEKLCSTSDTLCNPYIPRIAAFVDTSRLIPFP